MKAKKYTATTTNGDRVVGYLCEDTDGHTCITYSSNGVDVIMLKVVASTIKEYYEDRVWDSLTKREKKIAKKAAYHVVNIEDEDDFTGSEILRVLGYTNDMLDDRDLINNILDRDAIDETFKTDIKTPVVDNLSHTYSYQERYKATELKATDIDSGFLSDSDMHRLTIFEKFGEIQKQIDSLKEDCIKKSDLATTTLPSHPFDITPYTTPYGTPYKNLYEVYCQGTGVPNAAINTTLPNGEVAYTSSGSQNINS